MISPPKGEGGGLRLLIPYNLGDPGDVDVNRLLFELFPDVPGEFQDLRHLLEGLDPDDVFVVPILVDLFAVRPEPGSVFDGQPSELLDDFPVQVVVLGRREGLSVVVLLRHHDEGFDEFQENHSFEEIV